MRILLTNDLSKAATERHPFNPFTVELICIRHEFLIERNGYIKIIRCFNLSKDLEIIFVQFIIEG